MAWRARPIRQQPRALVQALRAVRRHRPGVVLGAGGAELVPHLAAHRQVQVRQHHGPGAVAERDVLQPQGDATHVTYSLTIDAGIPMLGMFKRDEAKKNDEAAKPADEAERPS